jgi:hypothetical protein
MMTPLNIKINPEKYEHPNQIKKLGVGTLRQKEPYHLI